MVIKFIEPMSRLSLAIVAVGVAIAPTDVNAELVLLAPGTIHTIDFTGFEGGGFSANPTSGQLDSRTWRVDGMSDGGMAFGDTRVSGDFARGISEGNVAAGGIYAFNTGEARGVGLGVQPIGSDFTPGAIVLAVRNETGQSISSFQISYDVGFLNNEERGNLFNFAFSTDDSTYTLVPSLDLTSPDAADSNGWTFANRSATLSFASEVANLSTFYVRWTGDDFSGSGSRDEFVLDNVSLAAVPEPNLFAICGIATFAFVSRRCRKF